VARTSDHGMSAVRVALLRAAWMYVQVGDHSQTAPFTKVPQLAEMPTIKPNDARVKAPWVKVIVEDEFDDADAAIAAAAEQEGSTFSGAPMASLAEICEKPSPNKP
jgi:hypothetical protein